MKEREAKIAEDIVLDAKEQDEEIWLRDTLQSLHDREGARVEFSPERVMANVRELAKKHKVKINPYH